MEILIRILTNVEVVEVVVLEGERFSRPRAPTFNDDDMPALQPTDRQEAVNDRLSVILYSISRLHLIIRCNLM